MLVKACRGGKVPSVSRVARIHYEIPEDLHRRVKSAAAMRGLTLKAWVIEALEQALEPKTEPAKQRPGLKKASGAKPAAASPRKAAGARKKSPPGP